MLGLNSRVENIPGIGSKTASALHSIGLETIGDLINNLPRTYNDFSAVSDIASAEPGNVIIRATIEKIATIRTKSRLNMTNASLVDSKGQKLVAVWFNQPYRAKQLQKGVEYIFTGKYDFKYGKYQLVNPACEVAKSLSVSGNKIMPIYSEHGGLKAKKIASIVKSIKPYIRLIEEVLPQNIVDKYSLPSRSDSFLQAHFPVNSDQLKKALERIAFEELFVLILAARLNRSDVNHLRSHPMNFNLSDTKKFVANLPFKLTDAQRKAGWEILQDLQKDRPMNRLLQGDVGSGKTVVASLAIHQVVNNGYQVALMVPTEVLALQHGATLQKILASEGIRVEVFTGSVKSQNRRNLLEQLAKGQINVCVGTHALFQKNVVFNNLGLVIIDEQHRFGVKQRQSLQMKTRDNYAPHTLSMTATPIPRSLQLTIFGDLDISTIDKLPNGRKPIITKILSPNERAQLESIVNNELGSGHQVYFVTKLIEDSEKSEKISAESLYERISKEFKNRRVGLLHGKMSPANKDEIMTKFKDHDIDILVSTTVIEVGVDVPNATVMVIENADQFGLAQLHQLRGRVGRGEYESYCYLMQTDTKTPTRRLREVERSNDGFYLAEADLLLRGAGELYGTAQHGELNLRVANLADTKAIKAASEAVNYMLYNYDIGEYLKNHSELAIMVNKYQRLTTLN